jgi:hypothetical protein
MTYRGQITKGQIVLDEPVPLPEGMPVNVEVTLRSLRITRPRVRLKPEPFDPLQMPGPSLADELVRDRR